MHMLSCHPVLPTRCLLRATGGRRETAKPPRGAAQAPTHTALRGTGHRRLSVGPARYAQARARRVAVTAAANDKKPDGEQRLNGEAPDFWDAPIFGVIFQGGFTAVVIAAVVFVLLLAWPVIQTMEESFPKA